MEFPTDYTEVKQDGPDKERKTSPGATSRESAALMEQIV